MMTSITIHARDGRNIEVPVILPTNADVALPDAQLAEELHLLALLLERHKPLITIFAEDWEYTIGKVEDNSAELHKGVVVSLDFT
jgi:hypothetical protein